jgi:hypothetical protein
LAARRRKVIKTASIVVDGKVSMMGLTLAPVTARLVPPVEYGRLGAVVVVSWLARGRDDTNGVTPLLACDDDSTAPRVAG